MHKILCTLFLCLLTVAIHSQYVTPTLDYYLPDEKFDSGIRSPEDFLGYQIGEWHITHDQMVYYMRYLADQSPRATLLELGRTHEGRPHIALLITSEQNHAQLEDIRKRHVEMRTQEDDPVVLWQGYTIHGDEPSGINASVLYAYWLLASQNPTVNESLDNAIVILYPCFNPDGANRFASWVNTHKNKNLTADNQDREYYQEWPRGRTNHYWFDLNRDWLVLSQPTSKAKNELFHQWKPNILTDHHEMGKDATFFFQPGVPARTHPLTPKANQALTAKIGTYHAQALDKIGSQYFTKQSYDDFYYGKGSTFPDIQGCIGILFEQASSRGHLQNTQNGPLSFPFTIRNQLTTSISTLKAGIDLRQELLEYQKSFYAQPKPNGGVVVGTYRDKARLYEFAQILEKQRIEYTYSDVPSQIGDHPINHSLQISFSQMQGKLAEAIFDTRTTFEDSIFYDISAFNLGQSFDLLWQRKSKLSEAPPRAMQKQDLFSPFSSGSYGYLMRWDSYYAPRTLHKLLHAGVLCKVATSDFSIGGEQFEKGTIFIPLQNQNEEKIHKTLENAVVEDLIEVYPLQSGSNEQTHLGNREWQSLRSPKVALLVGNGISPYDAGEVWHLLDQRYDIPITKIDTRSLSPLSLESFNTLIVNDIKLSISASTREYLHDWVKRGNVLIATETACQWLIDQGLSKSIISSPTESAPPDGLAYDQINNYRGARVTGGAILSAAIDLSHPLFYGYRRHSLPIFKNRNYAFENATASHQNPLIYDQEPLLNGYLHPSNRKHLSLGSGIQTTALRRGRVISILDNINFRGFWWGTDKIMANAIFFGSTINHNSCLD